MPSYIEILKISPSDENRELTHGNRREHPTLIALDEVYGNHEEGQECHRFADILH